VSRLHLKLIATCWIVICTGCGVQPRVTVNSVPNGGPLSKVSDSLYANVIGNALAPSGAISLSRLRSDNELTTYLGQLARMRTDMFMTRQSALAFWINAHNAIVMDLLRLNPGVSMEDMQYAHVAQIGDAQYSLNDIEHTILTKQFREPRAFFALWDGSRSSPPLRTEPYSEEQLSEQLDEQIKSFLADSTKNMLDRRANTIYLSQVFRDYRDEIEQVTNTLTAFIRHFAPEAMAHWIDGHPSVILSFLRYDRSTFSSDIEPAKHINEPRKPARRTSGGIQ
jgi:hypothetical protein